MTEKNLTVSEEDVVEAIRKHCDQFHTKQEAADSLEVSRVFLWKVLEGKVPPTTLMLEKLGYKRERIITYNYTKNENA